MFKPCWISAEASKLESAELLVQSKVIFIYLFIYIIRLFNVFKPTLILTVNFLKISTIQFLPNFITHFILDFFPASVYEQSIVHTTAKIFCSFSLSFYSISQSTSRDCSFPISNFLFLTPHDIIGLLFTPFCFLNDSHLFPKSWDPPRPNHLLQTLRSRLTKHRGGTFLGGEFLFLERPCDAPSD